MAMTLEERVAALEASLAALTQTPEGYYESKYSGEEIDASIDKYSDGTGDMTKAVYDPQGKAQDIFAYADAAAASAAAAASEDLTEQINGKQAAVTVQGILKSSMASGVSVIGSATPDVDYATPGLVDAAKPKATLVTLTAAGWDATAKTQTVTVQGIYADASLQIIQPTPETSSQAAYINAGVLATSQGLNSLTFTAAVTPTVDLSVYVVVTGVTT